MPLFDFGTANFEAPEGKKNSFFIGVEKGKDASQPNKFSKSGDDVVNVNPFALALAGAPLVLVTSIVLAFFILAPGNQTPFKFLDRFYPVRVEELRLIDVKKDKIAADAKAAAAKAKAAEEAKAKAAAEAAAAEAKKAPAPAAAAAKK